MFFKTYKEVKVDMNLKPFRIAQAHGADIHEPAPTHNENPAVWDLVMEDIQKRDKAGTEKYGTRLRPFNGRDALWDAYQEVLDLAVYLRQEIYQRDKGENIKKTYMYVISNGQREIYMGGFKSAEDAELRGQEAAPRLSKIGSQYYFLGTKEESQNA